MCLGWIVDTDTEMGHDGDMETGFCRGEAGHVRASVVVKP